MKFLVLTILLTFAAHFEFPLLSAEGYNPPLTTPDGFAVPQPGHRFEFPRDHGSHPEFKIEWWYVTGHLFSGKDRRFGFQATFFRIAGPHGSDRAAEASTNGSALFSTSELHLAHMALLDSTQKRFMHQERLNRAGWDAEARTNTLAVRNGNWSLRMDPTNGMSTASETGTNLILHLAGSIHGDAEFALQLRPAKPLVIFGENGVSRKGADPTAASYYLTFPRLRVTGSLSLAGRKEEVRGEAWMDHEISSSQLGTDQAGWDWASLQLNDGREIMVYRMRLKSPGAHSGNGSEQTDRFSTLAWIDASGNVTHLGTNQFTWTADRTWKSSSTGGVYPIHGNIRTVDPATGKPVTFYLEPLYAAQELNGALGGVPYWEGACRVYDSTRAEVGSAYLELTGYAGKFADRFR